MNPRSLEARVCTLFSVDEPCVRYQCVDCREPPTMRRTAWAGVLIALGGSVRTVPLLNCRTLLMRTRESANMLA